MMRIIFSKTSSKGNCSVIESSDGNLLCIDAGLKYKNVNREIGYKLHKCKTLLISHAHVDHAGRIADFTKIGMELYCSKETFDIVQLKTHYIEIRNKEYFSVPGFKVVPFELNHTNSDGSDCHCFGFLIQDSTSKEKMLWCTDTAYIPYTFPQLDFYCIEGNFWEKDSYIDDLDEIEKSVEIRRFRSHMSVNSAADFLKKQNMSKCKEVRLLHLSNLMTDGARKRIIPYIKSELGMEDLNIVI